MTSRPLEVMPNAIASSSTHRGGPSHDKFTNGYAGSRLWMKIGRLCRFVLYIFNSGGRGREKLPLTHTMLCRFGWLCFDVVCVGEFFKFARKTRLLQMLDINCSANVLINIIHKHVWTACMYYWIIKFNVQYMKKYIIGEIISFFLYIIKYE